MTSPATPVQVCRADLERILALRDTAVGLPDTSPLMTTLEQAHIIDHPDDAPGLVTMLSRIRLTEEHSGNAYSMTLTYPDSPVLPDAVSVFSPVGSKLLGLCAGQSVDWIIPGGRTLTLRILDVTHPGKQKAA